VALAAVRGMVDCRTGERIRDLPRTRSIIGRSSFREGAASVFDRGEASMDAASELQVDHLCRQIVQLSSDNDSDDRFFCQPCSLVISPQLIGRWLRFLGNGSSGVS
jgi:hypothetical protein